MLWDCCAAYPKTTERERAADGEGRGPTMVRGRGSSARADSDSAAEDALGKKPFDVVGAKRRSCSLECKLELSASPIPPTLPPSPPCLRLRRRYTKLPTTHKAPL